MQKHVYSHTDHLRIGDPCSSNTKKALISERLRNSIHLPQSISCANRHALVQHSLLHLC